MSARLGVVVDVGPPPVLVMEGIELEISSAGVVDELPAELIDGIVLLLVLVDGGEVELCAGAGVVDELFIELVDCTVPLPVLVRGVVELCAGVVGGPFVGLVNSIVPLLVPMALGVEFCTDGDRYNVLFEGLVNGVANTCELEFSKDLDRFAGPSNVAIRQSLENEIYL